MRLSRLLLPALALVVAGGWSAPAKACDKDKKTQASAASTASCTAEMAAACKAKGARSASMASCAGMTDAATAVATRGMKGVKGGVVTASAEGRCSHGISAVVAGAGGSCSAKSSVTAAGSQCPSHGTMAKAGHDCDACADMAICHDAMEDAGVRAQVVPLKNGVMFVYTADGRGQVNMVQSAMARRSEHLAQIITAGDKARLCPECKTLRGAMASGKLSREVVNIDGGALTLLTSSDPGVVAKIHSMVEQHRAARSKS